MELTYLRWNKLYNLVKSLQNNQISKAFFIAEYNRIQRRINAAIEVR